MSQQLLCSLILEMGEIYNRVVFSCGFAKEISFIDISRLPDFSKWEPHTLKKSHPSQKTIPYKLLSYDKWKKLMYSTSEVLCVIESKQ